MVVSGIRRWSFTRDYEVGDGPWPVDDEASVEYDADDRRVLVEGVFHDGPSDHEGCARRVEFAPDGGVLRVDVGSVRNGDEFVFDIAQRIHYRVEVVFADELPTVTEVRHVPDPETEQFATTVERPDA
ncbi:hypothetical protein [Halosimplex halophilum]|uniref:hypothetical protein n=1 Tax=Halosimplex halophilum TaxID=2559572 RepID=UPI00107FADF7|nr:hypothetical protein [Halosimplex halophilum]